MKTEHAVSSKAVVLLLFFIVCGCSICFLFVCFLLLFFCCCFFFWGGGVVPCFVLQYFVSFFCFAIISVGKRDLVAILLSCSECQVAVIVL